MGQKQSAPSPDSDEDRSPAAARHAAEEEDEQKEAEEDADNVPDLPQDGKLAFDPPKRNSFAHTVTAAYRDGGSAEPEDCDDFVDTLFDDAYDDDIYDFDQFRRLFGTVKFGKMKDVKVVPEMSWFDPEIALRERADLFAHHDPKVVAAVKDAVIKVNRWNFMACVIKSGEFWMSSSLALQMKIMSVFGGYLDFQKSGLCLLDAGCGAGYLLAAWALKTPADAEVWGLEVDTDTLLHARHSIFNRKDTFSIEAGTEEHKTLLQKIRIVKGDVKRMVAGSSTHENLNEFEPFPAEYFDAINVGVAMAIEPRMEECVKEGGLLLMPEAKDEATPTSGSEHVKSDAAFTVFRKQDSKLVPITSILAPSSCEAAKSFDVKFVRRTSMLWGD